MVNLQILHSQVLVTLLASLRLFDVMYVLFFTLLGLFLRLSSTFGRWREEEDCPERLSALRMVQKALRVERGVGEMTSERTTEKSPCGHS